MEKKWLLCPICRSKTRNIIREDTVLTRFPLYCPKCKNETLISINHFEIAIVEPDAKTQS
ncbi:TPA: cysteine-rich KTR domain-containing protein [Enterococcus faecium]